MAAFSTALALSLAGSAGLFAGKALAKKKAAPGEPLVPPDSARLASDAAAAAQLAGQKRRKMATAAPGVLGARPRRVGVSAVAQAPSLTPANFLERRY